VAHFLIACCGGRAKADLEDRASAKAATSKFQAAWNEAQRMFREKMAQTPDNRVEVELD